MSNGLNADKWIVKKDWYDIIPEEVDDNQVKWIKESIKDAQDVKGWTKDGTGKLLGRIPLTVYYNYAWANGVPNHQANAWYAEDGGKNLIKLLDEFKTFKVSNA